jgi:hypothetical protein
MSPSPSPSPDPPPRYLDRLNRNPSNVSPVPSTPSPSTHLPTHPPIQYLARIGRNTSNVSPAPSAPSANPPPQYLALIRGVTPVGIIRELAVAHSLSRDLERAKDDPTTSIEVIEGISPVFNPFCYIGLASRAWKANVELETRQIQLVRESNELERSMKYYYTG